MWFLRNAIAIAKAAMIIKENKTFIAKFASFCYK